MTTIAILSQKGGAGKTTLAINLAGAAEAAGHQVVIIDLDPQASAKAWYDRRGKEHPVVVSAQAAALAEVLATRRHARGRLRLHRHCSPFGDRRLDRG